LYITTCIEKQCTQPLSCKSNKNKRIRLCLKKGHKYYKQGYGLDGKGTYGNTVIAFLAQIEQNNKIMPQI